jgi:hypothetical protein
VKQNLIQGYLLPYLQEMYWRIPGDLSLQDLKKRIEIINQALDGSLIAQHSGKNMINWQL